MRTPSFPEVPFTGSCLPDLRLTRRALVDALQEGRVRRLLHNVYIRHDVPDSLELRAAAGALVVTPGVVFVDRTAAWLHGLDVFDYRELEVLPPLECVVLRNRSRIERPECSGGERDLTRCDLMVVHGLCMTTPLRTALDLGCVLSRPDGLAALDGFLRLRVGKGEMSMTLPRFRGRRGVVKQHWVEEDGRPLFRLDHAYPRHRVAVEYDGYEWHDRSDAQRSADRVRQRWLEDRGWTIVVVRKGDFSGERREAWLGELREALDLG